MPPQCMCRGWSEVKIVGHRRIESLSSLVHWESSCLVIVVHGGIRLSMVNIDAHFSTL